ncbi:MAG TPA: quaternary ammonium compound efflux SMR transporter SugE [Phycisphaeraceae bacterium]
MAWIYLIIAGLLEIGWAIGIKYAKGWTRPIPSVLTIAAMIVSFYLLAQAVRTLPIGTGYAIWTGIGAAGAAIAGMILFKEPATAGRLICIALILAGIVGLRITSPD